MDKKLYKELRELRKQIEEKYIKYSRLSSFLDNYKRFFKEERSLKAIKEIEDYVEGLRKQLSEERNNARLMDIKLHKSCEHEVLIKWKKDHGYTCFLCGDGFNMDNPKIKNASLLIDNLKEDDYKDVMQGLRDELIDNDQDIVEGVVEKIRVINDGKVLIRRR